MQRKQDLFVNLSIGILCLTVSGILIKGHFFPEGPPTPPPATTKGEVLVLPESVASGAAEMLLVAAVAPGCGYCNESMAFYRSLSDRTSTKADDVHFVAAVGDAEHMEKESTLLQNAGVDVDQIVVTDFKDLGVPGTPMLIVTDRRGEVLGAWLGKLSEEQEREVLETLGLGEDLEQG